MDNFSIVNGIEFSAELIPSKSVAISFGGIKGKKFQNAINQTEETRNTSKLFESTYLSYDIISINQLSIDQYKNQTTVVLISPNILNNFEDQSKKSRFAPNYEIGIEIDIFSKVFTKHQEGWFHRYFIEFMNSIKGLEYNSVDRHPYLKIRKDMFNFTNINNFFIQIGNNIMDQFLSQFPQIQIIQIMFKIGLEQVQAKRELIEKKLQEQRTKFLQPKKKAKNLEDFYALDFDQTLAPFSPILLSSSTNDPAGFLCYNEVQESKFLFDTPPFVKTIEKISPLSLINEILGEYKGLNEYFQKLSFQQIQKIQLNSTQYSLPMSPFSEIIFFEIPELNGFGLMGYDYPNSLLEKYTFKDIVSSYADGHQHSNLLGLNRFDIENERFRILSHNYEEIVWMNSSLLDKIRHFLPISLVNQIATEVTGNTEEELKLFLQQSQHPVNIRKNDRKSNSHKELAIKPDEHIETLLTDLQKSCDQPIFMHKLKLTLFSPTGEAFEVEFKNMHLKAEEILVRKKLKNN